MTDQQWHDEAMRLLAICVNRLAAVLRDGALWS